MAKCSTLAFLLMVFENHKHESILTRGQSSYLPCNSVAFGVMLQCHRELSTLVELAKGGWFRRALLKSPCSRGTHHLVKHKENGNEEKGAKQRNKQKETYTASKSVVL